MRFALILALVLSQNQSPPPAIAKRQPPQAQTTGKEQQASLPTRGTDSTPVVIKVLDSPHRQSDSAERAEESKDKATSDWWVVRLTGFLVFVGAGQAGLFLWQLRLIRESLADAKKTADAAEQSAFIAKETLIAANRPWVLGEFRVGSDLIFDTEGAHITFAYSLQNVGNTPAINVDVTPKFFPFQMGKSRGHPPNLVIEIPQTNPAEELLTLRANIVSSNRMLASAPESFRLSGDTIFPGKGIHSAVTLSMSKEQIDTALGQRHHKEIGPVLLVVIDYQSSLEPESHQTGLIFSLLRLDPRQPRDRFEIDPAAGTIAMNNLRLERYAFRSGFAN